MYPHQNKASSMCTTFCIVLRKKNWPEKHMRYGRIFLASLSLHSERTQGEQHPLAKSGHFTRQALHQQLGHIKS
jgi:hypothetical protein